MDSRDEIEQRLLEAEAKYRNLVEQLPAVTYICALDEVATHLYVSPQIEELMGYTPDEWMADPQLWIKRIHPDDRPGVLAEIERTVREQVPFSVEYRTFTKDHRIVWLRDQGVVVGGADGTPLYSQGIYLDITELKRSEHALAESERRFRALVTHAPVGIFGTNALGECTFINDRGCELLWMGPSEALGFGWTRALHPDDRDGVLAEWRRVAAVGGAFAMEYRFRGPKGEVRWMSGSAVPVRGETGEITEFLGTVIDITEKKRAEQALHKALAHEREVARRLRALDEMKNTFLAAVSHELRTPLAAVLGSTLTLDREELDLSATEVRELIRGAANAARKLDRLLSELLDVDRLARGLVTPQLRRTDVGALVRQTIDQSDVFGDRSIRVEADPVVVPVDPPKVERIVENLVVNAIKHTSPEASIWVRVQAEDDGALITVDDDGPGVPEDLREAIFEAFRRAPSASDHSPGTGIGLTLVTRFAELHGGRAWVEDRPQGGASFRVFLPGDPAGAFADARALTSRAGTSEGPGAAVRGGV
jgi:PAS domain S-box-containing protein